MTRNPCPRCGHGAAWHDTEGCAKGGCTCPMRPSQIQAALSAMMGAEGS